MDSTPPANTRSSQPEATFCAAMFTASRPEAQKRLSWTPATVSGSPALIAAVLAMSAPWSPIGETQPSTTSSTRCGSSSTLRPSISCIRPTTRSTGLVECSEPLLFPLPRGVRMASKTSASVAAMVVLLSHGFRPVRICPSMRTLVLDGRTLTPAAVVDIARGRAHAELADDARERNAAAERLVEELMVRGELLYGVTTGVGALRVSPFESEDPGDHQWRLLRSHAGGGGGAPARGGGGGAPGRPAH